MAGWHRHSGKARKRAISNLGAMASHAGLEPAKSILPLPHVAYVPYIALAGLALPLEREKPARLVT